MTVPPPSQHEADRDRRYEQLVELAPDGILVHDGEVILSANAAAVRLAGASREEQLVGQPVDMLLHPPHLKAVARQITNHTSSVELAPPVRDTLHRLDGGHVEVEVRAQVFVEGGRPSAHLVIRDITERLASEAVTREHAAQLQETQRLEAVSALAGGVAHEVNNMLQVIVGFGALLLDEREVTSESLANVREIIAAANHAAAITRQLLEFSRHAVHRPQSVDLSAMVRQLRPVIRQMTGEQRRLDVSAQESHFVWVDPGQLEQLVVNLIINARHATTHDDTIAIVAAEVEILRGALDNDGRSISPGRYGILSVRDTGSGMDTATRARIFEPFFTTKLIGGGTGLGLAAVAGIMAQNGGHITVKTALGEGSTFSLYFPLVAPSPLSDRGHTPGVNAPVSPPARLPAETTILVVDDEPAICKVTGRLLERAGYTVARAHSGSEALDLIERTGVPALILTDLGMPGMSGRELAQRIRAKWPAVPVVFMSGYAAGAAEYDAVDDPQHLLIEKPFDPAELLASVENVLKAVPLV
ncbi:response regulator [Gemmatimonas sp.]|uniref:response regulator n=1 Tax=Gemmatimonas sp. TaxID=1962908 RepID=UPI003983882E